MNNKSPKTSVFIWTDRHMSEQMVMDQAKALEASGVVDALAIPDHMVNLVPPSLWTEKYTPMAAVLSDPDSLMDAVVAGMIAHAAAPKLDLDFCGDAVRKNPADLCQLMWTLAGITEGRVRFQFGAGEIKNLNPYGHRRSEGLARFEDMLRVSKALWEAKGPIDYVGNHWELKQAYLGGAKAHRPRIWSMGTGPKQVDLATSLCDGITASMPNVWTTPDHARTAIEQLKRTLVEKGRNPDTFGFGSFVMILCHDDPAVLDALLDNPLIRWMSAIIGRMGDPELFRKEGIEPATPEGWKYFLKLQPYATSAEFAQGVIDKTTRKMAEKSFIFGNPEQVARQIQAYCDVGISSINLMDFTSMAMDPADAPRALERMIEVCAGLKGVVAKR